MSLIEETMFFLVGVWLNGRAVRLAPDDVTGSNPVTPTPPFYKRSPQSNS